jgi:hypothetical protein
MLQCVLFFCFFLARPAPSCPAPSCPMALVTCRSPIAASSLMVRYGPMIGSGRESCGRASRHGGRVLAYPLK